MWALQEKSNTKDKNQRELNKNNMVQIVILYTQGLSDSVKHISSKHGSQVHFKIGKTLKNFLITPKDKENIIKIVIYSYKYNRLECDEEYVGESAGTFGERFR